MLRKGLHPGCSKRKGGGGGELIEDYENNWGFINILRELRKRNFIGKITGFENGFLMVSNFEEEMNLNPEKKIHFS